MNRAIKITGSSPVSRTLLLLLQDCIAERSDDQTLDVITEWSSVTDLFHALRQVETTTVFIECTSRGLSVGPAFDQTAFGACLDCLIARRRSNGESLFVPSFQSSVVAVTGIATELEQFSPSDVRLDGLCHGQVTINDTGERHFHRVLAIPGCKGKCKNGGRVVQDMRTLFSVSDVISERVGIVTKIVNIPSAVQGFTVRLALGARTDAFLTSQAFNNGVGCAADPVLALTKAVAESCERYSATVYQCGLKESTPTQTTKRKFKGAIPMLLKAEGRVTKGSSIGLAAGPSLKFARRRALLEIVERDVFARAWNAGGGFEEIPRSGELQAMLARFFRIKGSHEAQGVAVVAAFLEAERPPYCAFGLAARMSEYRAAEAAGLEAIASASLALYSANWKSVSRTDSMGFEDFSLLNWTDLQMREIRQVRVYGCHGGSISPGANWARRFVPQVVDISSPDVLACGLRVVSVHVDGCESKVYVI